MNRGMISMFILFFGQRFVNLQDPNTLNLLRSVYVMIALLYYQTMNGLADKIADDGTPIWIPVAEKKGIMDTLLGTPDAAPKEWKATTMKEHEQTVAKERSGGAFMKAAMPFITSQFMGIHISILMALVTVPLDLWEDPLVRKYVLGWATPHAYGEKYSDPTGRTAAATGTVTDGTTAGTAPAGSGNARDDDYEEAIFRTWESQDPVEIPIFEQLLSVAGKDPNYGSTKQGWTALHVVAGSPQNGRREFIRLLELGCKPDVADKDGWTALHWAAYHGNVLAAHVLCSAYGVDIPVSTEAKGAPKTAVPQIGDAEDLRALLKQQDEKGRSAEQVARESAGQDKGEGAEGAEQWKEACKQVAALLEKALQKAADICKARGLSEKPKKASITAATSSASAAGPHVGLVHKLSREDIQGLLAREVEEADSMARQNGKLGYNSRGRSGSPDR